MKNTVVAIRSSAQLNVIVNGKSFYITCPTTEEAIELYRDVLLRKESGTDQDMEYLLKVLSPSYKMEVDLRGILKRDRLGNYFLGDYSMALPDKLLTVFKDNMDNDLPITNLSNFWRLLMLNPDKHVRDSLFKFMDRFQMPITDNGYFIAYKSVAWKGEQNRGLGVFVSQQYINNKASGKSVQDLIVTQKGDTDNFKALTSEEIEEIYKDLYDSANEMTYAELAEEFLMDNHKIYWKTTPKDELEYEDIIAIAVEKGWDKPSEEDLKAKIIEESGIKELGKLDDMFRNISTMFDFDSPTFTDWHTKKSTIVLGSPVKMPREECDNNPNNTCSSGLHVGAPGYVSHFGYGNENYVIACLVNPMNVVAIPQDYNFEKMRCCEYLPYAVCEVKEGVINTLDTNYFEDDYINYEKEILISSLEELDDSTEEGKERKEIIRHRLITLEN